MDEKENFITRPLKRKSILDFDDIILTKKLHTSITCDSIIDSDVSVSSIEYQCETPILYPENIHASCLTEPFKVSVNLQNSNISNGPVVHFSEFFKQPKPELCKSIEQLKDLKLERTPIETRVIEPTLNDSFEILKSQLYRSHTETPLSFGLNNTPETPCELHDIDLDNMGSIRSLSRTSVIDYHSPLTRRKPITNKIVQISPIYYEAETKSKESMPKLRRVQTEIPSSSRTLYPIIDDNRIEEINAELVSKIIENDFTSKSHSYHIIDCRYPYEFDGGHINGAVNLYTPYQMLNYVFLSNYDMNDIRRTLENPEQSLIDVMKQITSFERPQSHWKSKAFIFHCEFSSIRGPEMARCLRNMDRLANWNHYPQLYFPKVYIMTKGYKEFFSKYKKFCKPLHYVKMDIVDPTREKGECLTGESDDEDTLTHGCDLVDQETVKQRLKMYNCCKRESQDQIRIFSQLIHSGALRDDQGGD